VNSNMIQFISLCDLIQISMIDHFLYVADLFLTSHSHSEVSDGHYSLSRANAS